MSEPDHFRHIRRVDWAKETERGRRHTLTTSRHRTDRRRPKQLKKAEAKLVRSFEYQLDDLDSPGIEVASPLESMNSASVDVPHSSGPVMLSTNQDFEYKDTTKWAENINTVNSILNDGDAGSVGFNRLSSSSELFRPKRPLAERINNLNFLPIVPHSDPDMPLTIDHIRRGTPRYYEHPIETIDYDATVHETEQYDSNIYEFSSYADLFWGPGSGNGSLTDRGKKNINSREFNPAGSTPGFNKYRSGDPCLRIASVGTRPSGYSQNEYLDKLGGSLLMDRRGVFLDEEYEQEDEPLVCPPRARPQTASATPKHMYSMIIDDMTESKFRPDSMSFLKEFSEPRMPNNASHSPQRSPHANMGIGNQNLGSSPPELTDSTRFIGSGQYIEELQKFEAGVNQKFAIDEEVNLDFETPTTSIFSLDQHFQTDNTEQMASGWSRQSLADYWRRRDTKILTETPVSAETNPSPRLTTMFTSRIPKWTRRVEPTVRYRLSPVPRSQTINERVPTNATRSKIQLEYIDYGTGIEQYQDSPECGDLHAMLDMAINEQKEKMYNSLSISKDKHVGKNEELNATNDEVLRNTEQDQTSAGEKQAGDMQEEKRNRKKRRNEEQDDNGESNSRSTHTFKFKETIRKMKESASTRRVKSQSVDKVSMESFCTTPARSRTVRPSGSKRSRFLQMVGRIE